MLLGDGDEDSLVQMLFTQCLDMNATVNDCYYLGNECIPCSNTPGCISLVNSDNFQVMFIMNPIQANLRLSF